MALPVPASVTLKTPDRFRLIGKAADRLDTPDKSTGRQSFGIDARRPGMKTVLIARPPHFGGTVAGFDDGEARGVKGVDHVMQVDLDRGASGVAVVADGFWPAKMARDKLGVEWRAPEARADTGELEAQFRQLLGRDGVTARAGDVSGLAGAARTISADFRFPFLAHAPMEPLNALIEVTGTGSERRCDIRTGTQFQTIDQATVAAVLGLKPPQVHIHTQFAGGGFGRRATPTADYLADAARVMKAWLAAGRSGPLKVVWTREDDGRPRGGAVHRRQASRIAREFGVRSMSGSVLLSPGEAATKIAGMFGDGDAPCRIATREDRAFKGEWFSLGEVSLQFSNVNAPVPAYVDRLILEAARHHQAQSGPNHSVRLLTGDQGLARMALAEGVTPLYFRAVRADDFFGRRLTGQTFDPFAGHIRRTSLPLVLWELATAFGSACLCPKGESGGNVLAEDVIQGPRRTGR